MKKRRCCLIVNIDLDSLPTGPMYTSENAATIIQEILNERLAHRHPVVQKPQVIQHATLQSVHYAPSDMRISDIHIKENPEKDQNA